MLAGFGSGFSTNGIGPDFACVFKKSQIIRQSWRSKRPSSGHARHSCRHIGNLERTISGPRLDKFQRNAHENESDGESRAVKASLVKIGKPGHEGEIGERVRELVALRDWQFDGSRDKRKKDYEKDERPAHGEPQAASSEIRCQEQMPGDHDCQFFSSNTMTRLRLTGGA